MTESQSISNEAGKPLMKKCTYCQELKPLTEFQRRTGRRAGPYSRRGPCRSCRGVSGARTCVCVRSFRRGKKAPHGFPGIAWRWG